MRILDENYHNIREKIEHLLLNFLDFLKDQQAEKKDLDLIKDLILQIDDLFLLVVAGEYNSGKSAFINALLGDDYLETGITPTTSSITIVKYGQDISKVKEDHNQEIYYFPINLLKDISIVDTPGTNAILRDHEEITSDFIPRSDLVLFITSVDRPFTESEKMFLEKIRSWGKKIIFIINKIDILDSEKNLEEVKRYITENATKVLNSEPLVFPISSKQALDHKKRFGSADRNLANIEDYIRNTLGTNQYIALKFNNPLGVIENFSQKFSNILQNQTALLSSDIQLVDDISNELKFFKDEMVRNFHFRYAEVDNALLEFEKRGTEFFENTFRFGRIFDLINKERIQNEYQDTVIKGLSKEIDDQVNQLIDWLVEEDLKHWQAISQKIDARSHQFQNRIFDDQGSRHIRFERQKIVEKVKTEAEKIILKFNQKEEAIRISEEAQMAVAASAAIEAGALGLGAIVTILATTASADLTGVLLAGLTATLGLFILPAKKRNIRSLFSKNISKVRNELNEILSKEFEKQIENIINHIESTIAPYTRFIKSENEKLFNLQERLIKFISETKSIKQNL